MLRTPTHQRQSETADCELVTLSSSTNQIDPSNLDYFTPIPNGFNIDFDEKHFSSKKSKKSEKNFHPLNLSGVSSIVINWSDYTSQKNAIKYSVERFKNIFQHQKFPNVEKLVLINFVYSSELLNLLFETFNGLKTLIVESWNFNSEKLDMSLMYFTLDQLEITLPTSMSFHIRPPIKLNTIIINSLQPNSKTKTTKCKPKRQTIDAPHCESLMTIIVNQNPLDPNIIHIRCPVCCVENLYFFSNGGCSIHPDSCVYPDLIWSTNFVNVFVGGEENRLNFITNKPDANGERQLKMKICPKCENFGVYDEFGKTRIIWKKQQ
jgi:hypothetical protein